MKKRVLIMGAAGRDFHNFNVVYRDNPDYEVVAFTATQIPGIDDKKYPAALAGKLYPNGIPIYPESDLDRLIAELNVDEVVFAYSDQPHVKVMNKAFTGPCRWRRFLAARAKEYRDQVHQAGHLHLRRPHRIRQEPDQPRRCPRTARSRQEGRFHPAPDALW